MSADKTPRPGGVGRKRGDDKAEGAAVFHWNSAHSYAPADEEGWRRPRGFAEGGGWSDDWSTLPGG